MENRLHDLKLSNETSSELAFLSGGGEMGERIRAFDWTSTPLGSPAQWPQSLKTAVRIMLLSRQPIWIGWGQDLIYLYNDPYKSVIGGRHPTALGKPTKQVWPEIWPVIGPMLETAMQGAEGTYVEEQLLIMERHGYREEVYYTYSYTPIPDESGAAGGIICANTDDTQRVIGQRQLALLRELAALTADVRTSKEVCEQVIHALAGDAKDLPFALLYVVEESGESASLKGATGLQPGHAAAPAMVSLDESSLWPFKEVLQSNTLKVIPDLDKHSLDLPAAPWSQPPATAVVLPLAASGKHGRSGILVAGLNPFRQFNDDYRSFLSLVSRQITGAITIATAYEEERKRAEALAELDRAKTAFFNNVSHEFRTPLTLMLGPIEELQKNSSTPEQTQLIDLLHRNSERLLKLVNTLLEFSRIEAGRMEASYAPTDLAAYTAELASVFRSAVEKAGLQFKVNCPPLAGLVYVDREMWEKIVLNLVSNALKFTFSGEIEVSLRWCGEHVELLVRDTGLGIPESELPKMFQRFYRVRGMASRTHEGTGIGLALVRELALLHGGEARVESQEGRGSTFIISIKTGRAHLPHEHVHAAGDNSRRIGPTPFIEEALRWVPEPPGSMATDSHVISSKDPSNKSARILLADDNADMRDYVRRLLAPNFHIDTVSDGQAALEHIQVSRPDLLITDVMMPRVDGFALLEKLRSNPDTCTLPIILLSARAGEEARVEGLDAGADDYLIKPFGARELMARVDSHLKLSRLRRENEQRMQKANEELHEAHEQLADRAVHLEKLVQQRTSKLQDAVAELEAFSYSIAHDMRAPLRSLQGFGMFLAEEYSDKIDATGQDYLRRLTSSAARMDRLIQDILNYSRVVRGELKLDPLDVAKLLKEIVESYPAFQNPFARITIEAPFPKVLGNEAALTQCLSNLLGNAIKFVPAGVNPEVRVWSETLNGHLRVCIKDNGIGIDPEHHERIFAIFQRVSKSFDGTGIGLAIVKKTAERMGGRVGVESSLGHGSTFWVELRLAEGN